MNPEICRTQRNLMMEHVLGELGGLKKTRLESHLDRCDECQRAYDRLSRGFGEARSWAPRAQAGEVDRMMARLTPLMEPEPEPPPRFEIRWGFSAVVFGAAATAALVAVVTAKPGPEFIAASLPMPEAVRAPAPKTIEPADPASLTIERRVLGPHLKAVASPTWNGVARSAGADTELEMSEGFAVLDYEGGEGRALRVMTPDLRIEVLGTRFFVETHPGRPTTVGVLAGKVAVVQDGRREELPAGTIRGFDGERSYPVEPQVSLSHAHHEDAFLKRNGSKPARAPVETPASAGSSPEPAAPSPVSPPDDHRATDVVTAFTQAEGLVREGKVDEALEVYDRLLLSDDLSVEPFIDLVRYERARVWGFMQGDLQRASDTFERLARHGKGEVRLQAALAKCECDLARDRCAAKSCLQNLANHVELRAENESQVLLRSWGISDLVCGDHKNESAPQLPH